MAGVTQRQTTIYLRYFGDSMMQQLAIARGYGTTGGTLGSLVPTKKDRLHNVTPARVSGNCLHKDHHKCSKLNCTCTCHAQYTIK